MPLRQALVFAECVRTLREHPEQPVDEAVEQLLDTLWNIGLRRLGRGRPGAAARVAAAARAVHRPIAPNSLAEAGLEPARGLTPTGF